MTVAELREELSAAQIQEHLAEVSGKPFEKGGKK